MEGFVGPRGFRTWYSVVGDLASGVTPLIGLHGGPGWPHYSLVPLRKLAELGIPVILYDQLGCGNSDQPSGDPEQWTIGLFLEELDDLISELGLEEFDLLGHSWGGALALEYLLSGRSGCRRLILSSPLLDASLWVKEADRLKDELGRKVATTMRRHEFRGSTDSKEYQEAYRLFKQQFVCRVVPQPELHDLADKQFGLEVYNAMWGPSEAYASGNLKDYSALNRLGRVNIPTLLLSGRYDEATPWQMSLAEQAIPGCKWVVLEESSHSAIFEQPEQYLAEVAAFLRS